jgi:hypothetical protein
MVNFNRKHPPSSRNQGFNLIEILLAITFFSLAFSGMLLGSTAMINTSTNGTKINEDNAVMGAMFTGINAQSAYVEASAAQLTTGVASAQSVLNNPSGDINTRQALIIPDATTSTTDNRRFYFERLVFSNLETPDVKTAQLDVYTQPAGGTPIKSVVRRLDKREECFAMGVEGSLYLPSFGQPCTGWSSGVNVPQARAMTLDLPGNNQDFRTSFRINGATAALVTDGRFRPFDATAGAPPMEPTDKGHQVDNGITAEYWIEATPNVAYNLIVGLRKQTNAQTYTVSVNRDYTGAIDCDDVTPRPRNCQREIITVPEVGSTLPVADGQPFSVRFDNIMPYSVPGETRRVFRIQVLSTVPPLSTLPVRNANPAVIHYIKKELARN